MSKWPALLVLAVLGASPVACSRSARTAGTGDEVADLLLPAPPDLGPLPPPPDGGNQGGCVGDGDTIYLAGSDLDGAALYSFSPRTFQFQRVAALAGCPPSVWSKGGFYPTAIALDRTTAWINFWDGGNQVLRERLYTFDLATGACTDSGRDLTGAHPSFLLSGLAALPDRADPARDTLYATIQYPEGAGMTTALATVDTSAWTVRVVAPITAAAKLADTGDGRLFAYQAGSLVELDPARGTARSSKFLKLPLSSWPGMAIVLWQKQVWIFVSADSPLSSVTHAYLIDVATGGATEKAVQKDLYAIGAVAAPCVAIPPPG